MLEHVSKRTLPLVKKGANNKGANVVKSLKIYVMSLPKPLRKIMQLFCKSS